MFEGISQEFHFGLLKEPHVEFWKVSEDMFLRISEAIHAESCVRIPEGVSVDFLKNGCNFSSDFCILF